jgi:hypothetical protein
MINNNNNNNNNNENGKLNSNISSLMIPGSISTINSCDNPSSSSSAAATTTTTTNPIPLSPTSIYKYGFKNKKLFNAQFSLNDLRFTTMLTEPRTPNDTANTPGTVTLPYTTFVFPSLDEGKLLTKKNKTFLYFKIKKQF